MTSYFNFETSFKFFHENKFFSLGAVKNIEKLENCNYTFLYRKWHIFKSFTFSFVENITKGLFKNHLKLFTSAVHRKYFLNFVNQFLASKVYNRIFL